MMVHKWGLMAYEEAQKKMQKVHQQATLEQQNHLIMTTHPECFTVGRDGWDTPWEVDVIKSDRGGSITAHSKGQNIYYFCFHAPYPARFFNTIITLYEAFFSTYHEGIVYDKKNPGFYIENRKIASLGFRYKDGVSLHGVAINVDVDLSFHSQIAPCNLVGIVPTSLHQESIMISTEDVDREILSLVLEHFDESL